MLQINNSSRVMETRNHSKNGAISKSQMSRGNFLRIILAIAAVSFVFPSFAQDFTEEPKTNERVIGTVTETLTKDDGCCGGSMSTNVNEVYTILLEKAKKEYPNKIIDLRNLNYSVSSTETTVSGWYSTDSRGRDTEWNPGCKKRHYSCNAKIIEFVSPETQLNETLVKAVEKAMSKVRAGSRLAIDQISVSSAKLDKETINDQLIDILLDNGYKVVAKEYLEKLKEEQEQQTSGGHNEKTTVKTDNFSGVGYFLNIRVNEKSIRFQVINVSTGEYEGNATVDF